MRKSERIYRRLLKLNKKVKLCISSIGEDLNSNVDPRFGRCDYFLIINPNTMQNTASSNHQ